MYERVISLNTHFLWISFLFASSTSGSRQDKQTMYHVTTIVVQIRDLLLVHLSHDHGRETSDVDDRSSHL